MRTCTLALSICILSVSFGVDLSGQTPNPNWHYLRSGNTGVAGEEHHFISSDPLGQVWTGGRSVGFASEGSLVRFHPETGVFDCWSDFEGYLPGSIVTAAEADPAGGVWVGTTEGLAHGTAQGWTHYTSDNAPLPSSNIRDVMRDASGQVWVAFQEVNMNVGGIGKWDGSQWTIFTPANSGLPDHTCRKILQDGSGALWVLTDLAVTRWENGNWTTYDWNNSTIPGWGITSAAIDDEGRFCVVTGGWAWSDEVAVWDDGGWTSIGPSQAPWQSGVTLLDLYFRNGRAIYSVSGPQGLGCIIVEPDGTWAFHPSGEALFDVHIDPSGVAWMAGIAGVFHETLAGWRRYTRFSAGLSEDFNNNILIDSQQRFWAANGNGGINLFDCPRWESYGPLNESLYPSPQSLSYVGSAICEDSEGHVWFAYNSTSGTVVKIPEGNYADYGSWEVFDASNSPVSWVTESVADGHGQVFFYSDYGTHMWSEVTSSWTTWDLTNSPLQYYTYGLGTDPDGRAYFGGFQQVAVYDATALGTPWSVMNLVEMGAPEISVVQDLAFAQDGAMYLATPEGLWKWHNSDWTHYTNPTFLQVNGVEVAQDGTVWICGYDAAGFISGGVGRMLPGASNWEIWTSANSDLPAEQIDDLALDAAGNVWINAYPKGIAIFNPEGLVGLGCLETAFEAWESTAIEAAPSTSSTPTLTVVPNPSSHGFEIRLPVEAHRGEVGRLEIFDLGGRGVMERWMSAGEQRAWVQDLAPGAYTLRYQSRDMTLTARAVVQFR